MVRPISLAPRQHVDAPIKMVDVQNYPASVCRPTPVDGLPVYVPGSRLAKFIPFHTTGCRSTNVTTIFVKPGSADLLSWNQQHFPLQRVPARSGGISFRPGLSHRPSSGRPSPLRIRGSRSPSAKSHARRSSGTKPFEPHTAPDWPQVFEPAAPPSCPT